MPLPYPRNLMDPNANYYTGEPVMSPAPNRRHQDISRQLVRQIGNFLDGKPRKLYHAPFDVRLFEKDGDTPEDVDSSRILPLSATKANWMTPDVKARRT